MIKRSSKKEKGLITVCFKLPSELWKRLKIRTIRDRISIRAVAAALVTAYIEGEFEYEKEKVGPKEKV